MNILVLTKNLPYPPDQGASIRNFHLLKNLAKYHDIYLLSIIRSEKEAAAVRKMEVFCKKVVGVPLRRSLMVKAVDLLCSLFSPFPYTVLANTHRHIKALVSRMLSENAIDLVQIQELYLAANVRQESITIPVVLDAHNSEPLIFERMIAVEKNWIKRAFYLAQKKKMAWFERKVAQAVSGIFSVSAQEKAYFEQFNKHVFLVPNGIEQIKNVPPSTSNKLLFTGLLSYPPNRDALLFFLEEIWPLIRDENPFLQLDIVGRSPDAVLLDYADARVRLYPDEDDISSFFSEARIVVVPLRAGGGTRFKILEAFAERVPVVSTSIGADGLEVKDNHHLLIRDTPESFAEAVLELYCDHKLSLRMVENASLLLKEKYLWADIVNNCVTAYQAIQS
jgi:polysaccharide biosynthesis protein PslH